MFDEFTYLVGSGRRHGYVAVLSAQSNINLVFSTTTYFPANNPILPTLLQLTLETLIVTPCEGDMLYRSEVEGGGGKGGKSYMSSQPRAKMEVVYKHSI